MQFGNISNFVHKSFIDLCSCLKWLKMFRGTGHSTLIQEAFILEIGIYFILNVKFRLRAILNLLINY